MAAALLGFGLWQIVDVVGFHWILRIHRIRVGVDNPLLYDLGWLVVFAGPSLLAARWLWNRSPPDNEQGHRTGGLRRAPALLALLAVVTGPVSALPPAGMTTAIVVFRSGVDSAQAFAAVADADARVLWASRTGDVLAVDLGATGDVGRLYRGGALLVSTSALAAGCLAWSKA